MQWLQIVFHLVFLIFIFAIAMYICAYLLFYTLQICVQESIAALWAQRNRALLQ